MKRQTFGKDFTVAFSYENESAPSADSPSIALYSEKPSKTDARNVTGTYKVGATITSWSSGAVTNTYDIDIPAITDPQPDDTETKTYYLAVNYTLKVGGQSQLVLMPFYVSKALGTISGHELTVQDVVDIFPTISDYIENSVITKYITAAVSYLKRDLKQQGLYFEEMTNQDEIAHALALKAIALCSYSEFQEDNDQFFIRARDYNAEYQKDLDSIQMRFDTNQDGASDTAITKKNYFVFNNAK